MEYISRVMDTIGASGKIYNKFKSNSFSNLNLKSMKICKFNLFNPLIFMCIMCQGALFGGNLAPYARDIIKTPNTSKNYFTDQKAVATTVSGTVKDNEGNPLVGASVSVAGSTLGAITDIDGKYTIDNVDENAVLVFSYFGYTTQEIALGGRSSVDVVLEQSAEVLDELLVVGYSTQTRATLTGSVVSIGSEELLKNKAPNVINNLAGKLAGVIINNRSGQPGRDDPQILIRGRSTTGDSNPLFIIDGVQRPDLGRLNPNDIESITVLKDASAAIYGARAANGVMLVTTKRGKKGAPKIELSVNTGVTQPTRTLKMGDSPTFAQVYNEIEVSEGRAVKYSEAELAKFAAGTEDGYTTTQWYDLMTKKYTPINQINLSTSGGDDKVSYYVGLGYMNQDGHFVEGTTNSNRYNFRSNIDLNVNKNLKIGLDLSGRQNSNHYPGNPDTRGIYSHMYLYQPNWTLYHPGTDKPRPLRDNQNLTNWVTDLGGYQDEKYKALESKLHFRYTMPWLSGLSINGSANYDTGYNHQKRWALPTYVYYPNGSDLRYARAGQGADLAQLNELFNQRQTITLNSQINYDKTIGSSNIGALLGYEQMKYNDNSFAAGRTDFPSTALPQIFAGSSDKNKQSNDGIASATARQNYFGKLTYDYSRKYLAQFIFRYDGSPNFPADKRWGFFPSVSLGWRISEESFLKNSNIIDNLKLRGSYGTIGNDAIPAFQYVTSYGYNRNFVLGNNDVIGLVQSGAPNPNITWETAKVSNVGFELSLFEGKITSEFDLFNTTRSNILTKRTVVIPDYTGLILPDENIGIVENKGFELQLQHRNNIKSAQFSIGGNISMAKNKVIFADEPPAAEPYQAIKGYPIGAGLFYKAVGIYKDKAQVDSRPGLAGVKPGDIIYEDVNKDGAINSRDRIRLDQTATPEITYGVNGSVEVSNFDLSVLLQGQAGATARFDETDNFFPVLNYGLGNFLQWRATDRWSPANTDATMPRATLSNTNNNTLPSTQWLLNASFMRLKNVELGYTFPADKLKKIGIGSFRIYANGNNLALLYDKMKDLGFDPETNDYWYYPQQRSYNFGINLTF
jgi:TonB-linked SusC/RagA family outer membrane protein